MCAVAQPNVTARNVELGEPLWEKTNPPLQNHIRAAETEATYALPVWLDPPNDEETGQILDQIKAEWTFQIKT